VHAKEYRAFISYSHRDSRWAAWLHRSLEGYHPPRELIGTVTERGPVPKRLAPVFRDRDELASATDLGTLLRAALDASACQVVICSPAAARSQWVNEEILAFKRLGREDRIFCLIVGGEPNASDLPDREEEECFPTALRFRIGADGELTTERTEPIAADARPGKDGRGNALLKLIAGLLGVGFDALRRREQQRRYRRLVAFSVAAAGGMILTSGLAAYALVQRAAAQRETVRAETEARTANLTTKFLVDLFRISDPSEARGNTVTAREMLDKGAARVDTELASEPAIHARLLDTLGTVYVGLGLYDKARPLLDRAVTTRRTLTGRDPLELARSLRHQGDLMMLQADYEAAEKVYRDAIRIDSARPDDRASQEALAAALYGLGTLQAQAGRDADAEKTLRDALSLQQSLYGEKNADVARTLKDLAQTIADGGNLGGGILVMRQAATMQRELRGDEPHPDLAETLTDLGTLLQRQGDLAGTERLFREALAMNQRLLGERHPEIASSRENLASVLQDRHEFAEAEQYYRQALDMRRQLQGADHPDAARTLFNIASLQFDLGESALALANAQAVLHAFRKSLPADHPLTAFALNVIGFWQTLAGDLTEANRSLDAALAMRRRLFGDGTPDVASSLAALAVLRDAEGRYPEALDLARQSKAIYTQALSADHWRTAFAESAEGAALTGLHRYAEADTVLVHSFGILKEDSGAPFAYRRLAQRYLDDLHSRERKLSRQATAN
jgi:tetratricopeptide (TPR) repeat protein